MEPIQPPIVADYERIAEDQMAECDSCFDEYPAADLSFPYDPLYGDTGTRFCERCMEDAREHEYERRVTL